MDRYLETALRDSERRFNSLMEFIRLSEGFAPTGDVSARSHIYSSWVMLAYATTEAGIERIGSAALALIGKVVDDPAALPPEIRTQHRRRSLKYLAHNLGDAIDAEWETALQAVNSSGWAEHSQLLRLDSNVWPSVVREWLARLNVPKKALEWLSTVLDGDSITLESSINLLVAERNLVAHGGPTDNLRNGDMMIAWAETARSYVESVGRTLQAHLVDLIGVPTMPIGEVDEACTLGSCTVAIKNLEVDLCVGDRIVLHASEGGEARSARIVSMQHDGEELARADAGAARIAVTIDRKLGGGWMALPL